MGKAKLTTRKEVATQLAEPVTKGDLYAFDMRLGERFTVLQASINGLHERVTAHESGHVAESRAETVAKEITLDAKKVGLVGALGAIIATVAAALARVAGGV